MKVKYPRTTYLNYSPKMSEDAIILDSSTFSGKKVIISIKEDGENYTFYNNFSHARSLDSNMDSEDRRWMELFRSMKLNNISDSIRICGENLFYKHTVKYKNLKI